MRTQALLCCLALTAAGCSYQWDPELDGPGAETADPTNADPTNADPTDKGDRTPTSSGSGSTVTPTAFCSAATTAFCDDFDGAPAATLWDGVIQRSPATVQVVNAATAPSGSRVLEIKTTRFNNPGEAYVEQTLSGTPNELHISFYLRRPPSTVDRTVDVLQLQAPQMDGSSAKIVWSFAATGESTLKHTSGTATVDTISTGMIATDVWLPVELRVSATGTTFTVGANTVTRPQVKPWSPVAGGTRFALGLLNLVNQGGGWQLQFDNVVIK